MQAEDGPWGTDSGEGDATQGSLGGGRKPRGSGSPRDVVGGALGQTLLRTCHMWLLCVVGVGSGGHLCTV